MSPYKKGIDFHEEQIRRVEKTLRRMTEFYRSPQSLISPEIRDRMISDIKRAYELGKEYEKLTTSLHQASYEASFI